MKVYVAGSSKEREERAKPMMKALRLAGVEITFDWTVPMDRAVEMGAVSDADVSEEQRRRCAILDANGVRTADLMILLAPNDRGSTGAWIEIGLAIAYGVPVVVCGANNARTIFTSLALARFETDREGYDYLKQQYDGGRGANMNASTWTQGVGP